LQPGGKKGRILLNNLQTFRVGASKVKGNNMVEKKGQTILFIFKSLKSYGLLVIQGIQWLVTGLLVIITH
jgi:hypothetical protein